MDTRLMSVLHPGAGRLLLGGDVMAPYFVGEIPRVNVTNFDAFDEDLRIERDDATHYGVMRDSCYVLCNSGSFYLTTGMYFSVVGPIRFRGGRGCVITMDGYRGLTMLGGPIEHEGRLRYIDGCSDSLLIGPPKVGEPCLNYLHFPPSIRQTMHTHPSLRAGMIVRGSGRAVTPEGELPLTPGCVWILPSHTAHCFYTDGEAMDVVAWHPDSDQGPTDDDHPMLNRTLVGGVSAKYLPEIRTQKPVS